MVGSVLFKFKVAFNVANLGANWWNKFYIFFLVWYLFFLNIVKVKKTRLFKLNLIYNNYKFIFFVNNIWNILILEEIFIKNIYKMDLRKQPEKILDLGANIGASAVYYSIVYPNAAIMAVEPDPANLAILYKNIENNFNIKAKGIFISGKNENVDFFVSLSSSLSSSLVRKNNEQYLLKISALSLDNFLAECSWDKVDLVKFDVEGAEYDIFKNCKNLNKFSSLVGEYHEDLTQKSLEDFKKIFIDFDIKILQTTKNRHNLILKNVNW